MCMLHICKDSGRSRECIKLQFLQKLQLLLAGSLGEWWRATNGILQGCALSVVLINVVASIWKMEIDDMRQHVVVANRQLPPRNVGPPLLGMPSALEPHGAGMAAI